MHTFFTEHFMGVAVKYNTVQLSKEGKATHHILNDSCILVDNMTQAYKLINNWNTISAMRVYKCFYFISESDTIQNVSMKKYQGREIQEAGIWYVPVGDYQAFKNSIINDKA